MRALQRRPYDGAEGTLVHQAVTCAAMTTYCAPCITDLALMREAVTAVGGTACCAAHAVLLTHPHDSSGRRRARLQQLRQLAESKTSTAPVEEQPGQEAS